MSENTEGIQPQEITPKRIIKVEARPVQQIIDEWYMGADDYSWAEDMGYDSSYDEEVKREEEEFERSIGGKIDYEPFDTKAELRAVRQDQHDNAHLSQDERQARRLEQMRTIRENLAHQTTGLATTIRDLFTTIQDSPDLSEDELMQKVREVAPEYRFTKEQLYLFRRGIEQYAEKHRAVEKFRGMYPDDKDLFEHCFGRRPVGEVSVVKRPMILHFGCGNKDDYVWAHSFYKTDGDEAKLEEEDVERALRSGGVALSHVKESELAGTVTVEQASKVEYRNDPKEKTVAVEKELELYTHEQVDDVIIDVPQVGRWKLKIVDRDDLGKPTRLQFWDSEETETEPLFDLRIIDNPNGFPLHSFEDVTGKREGRLGNDIQFIRKDGKMYGHINVNPSFIKIVSDGRADVTATYTTREFEVVETGEVEFSESTLVHEEQHQFNKLYVPMELREYMGKIMQRAAEHSDNPEEMKQSLARELVRFYRRDIGIDTRARDEILAFYRGGTQPSSINEILANSQLYNYRDQYKDRIEELPNTIAEAIKREMSVVMLDATDEGEYLVDAVPFEIAPEDVSPHIDTVFKDEYEDDLKKWTSVVSSMESKGYSREEILSLLYQEPANAWYPFAKRLPDKSKVVNSQ